MTTPDTELATLREELATVLLDAVSEVSDGERPELDDEDKAQVAALTGALVKVFADQLDRVATSLPSGAGWDDDACAFLYAKAAEYRAAVAS